MSQPDQQWASRIADAELGDRATNAVELASWPAPRPARACGMAHAQAAIASSMSIEPQDF